MGKRDISPYQIHEKKKKEGIQPKWQYNQVHNVWSPVFTKSMFEMEKLQSAMFGVPNIQFSRLEIGQGARLQIYDTLEGGS